MSNTLRPGLPPLATTLEPRLEVIQSIVRRAYIAGALDAMLVSKADDPTGELTRKMDAFVGTWAHTEEQA